VGSIFLPKTNKSHLGLTVWRIKIRGNDEDIQFYFDFKLYSPNNIEFAGAKTKATLQVRHISRQLLIVFYEPEENPIGAPIQLIGSPKS